MFPFTPNVAVDIYRGYNPNDPLGVLNGQPAVPGANGFLKHHVKNGRFGFSQRVFWTNLLYLPINTDIRSAFNSNLNPINPALSDTVVIPDYPIDNVKTAFQSVMVQLASRGNAFNFLKVYLDKAGKTVVRQCCEDVPNQLQVTLTSPFECPCLDGQSFQINFNTQTGQYEGNFHACNTTGLFTLTCFYPPIGVTGFGASMSCGNDPPIPLTLTDRSNCVPFHVQFAIIGRLPTCCGTNFLALSYADITL